MDELDAIERYTWAAMLDKFGKLPAQLADLTDWQIARVVYHKRDKKDGSLVAPAGVGDTIKVTDPAKPNDKSPEAKLATIAALLDAKLIKPENAEALREKIRNEAK